MRSPSTPQPFEPRVGDRVMVCVTHDPSRPAATWSRGVVEDRFFGPLSGERVYTVNGTGYYANEVRPCA